MKTCTKCKEEKEISDFYIQSRNGKPKSHCKVCSIKSNSQRKKNIRDLSIITKTCNICKEIKNSDLFSDNYLLSDGISNVCKTCSVDKSKKYVENNKEYIKEKQQKYRDEHKEEAANYNLNYKSIKLQKNKTYRDKYLMNPINKFRKNIRNLILDSFKRTLDGRFKKKSKSEEILGCLLEEFIIYIESLFQEGMSFDNHGQCEECWHIDHKIPISSAKTEEEIIKLNHYSNLQPLWSRENLSKGKKSTNN